MLHYLWRELRNAGRLLVSDWRFSLILVTVLGLGIGVANMHFVLVNAFCLRGLPVPQVDRVLFISGRDAQGRDLPLSYRELESIASDTRGFARLAGFANAQLVVGGDDRAPERLAGTHVSATAFRVLAEQPTLGRTFELSDDRPGATSAAVISDRLWRSRYAADRAILGRVVRIDDVPTVVIGVMGLGFRFPNNTDVWRPLAAMPRLTTDARDDRSLSVIARLTPAASLSSARAELAAVAARMARDFPESNREMELTVVPINERYNARITEPTWLAFIGVGMIVVLIACANAANLLLMRSLRRRHEMAVRSSLGASRAQLVRQLLVENGLAAFVAGIVGALLSLGGLQILTSVIPENTLGYFTRFTIDARVFVVLCALCLGSVFLFGLAPAIRGSRARIADLVKEGARGSTVGTSHRRWTTALLTVECALTMVLLAALALGVRVAGRTDQASTSVDADHVTVATVALPRNRYPSATARAALYRDLGQRLENAPGVEAVTFATSLPLGGDVSRRVIVDGGSPDAAGAEVNAWTVALGGAYFDALGLRLLRGRAFGERDGSAGNEAVIVNQLLATELFGEDDAVGRRVGLINPTAKDSAPPLFYTIVGVSPTVRQRPTAEPDLVAYLPLAAAPPTSANVIVRGSSSAATIPELLQDVVRGIDPELLLYRVRPMSTALQDAQWNARLTTRLIRSIAIVAVLLAVIGLYGVFTHAVVQREQEIAIRMALGARRSAIAAAVARRAAIQVALGTAAGASAAWAFERALRLGADPFGYRLSDPLTLVVASLLLATVTAVATVSPAYRAARLDPGPALQV